MKKYMHIIMALLFVTLILASCSSSDQKTEEEIRAEIKAEMEREENTNEGISPKVYAGTHHTLAIKDDGSLWAWGSNYYGQLGNGNRTTYKEENVKLADNDESRPIKIMDNVLSATAGENFSLAITKNNELYGWGDNSWSQLGIDNMERSSLPVKIMDNVILAEAADLSAAIIKADNSLWFFGKNYGANDSTPVPKKILDNVKDVSLGHEFAMAVTLTGELYMWGRAIYFAGNDENSEDVNYYASEPLKIMDSVADISGNFQTPLIVTKEGDLYSWGFNGEHGALGTGTDEFFVEAPQLVMKDVKKALSFRNINGAIKNDNSMWIWGGNASSVTFFSEHGYGGGSILDELLQYGNKPVKILDNIIWANGRTQIFAIDVENNLWGWGGNQFGKIGDGTVTTHDYEVVDEYETFYYIKENNEKKEPQKIMSLTSSTDA